MNDVMIGVAHDAPLEDDSPDFKNKYLESLTLIERLHRRLLDVIKDEFERRGDQDINAVQALLLFNMGGQELTAGELKSRGHYLGSNVSYNLKKLVQMGFIHHERSTADKRSVRVCLSEKGQQVHDLVDELYNRQLKSIREVAGLDTAELDRLNKALGRLERFWTDQIRYRL